MIGEAAKIAHALKAKPNGDDWMASCPCSGHGKGRGDKNPSLSIKEGESGELLLHCFAGCTWDEITSELGRRGIIIRAGGSRLAPARNALAFAHRAPPTAEPDEEARRLWRDSIPLTGTPASDYLDRRGITQRPATLRCCYYDDDPLGLIAAVQRSDDEIIAAQVKMITRDGRKALGNRPDTIGSLGDGAVRLGPAAEIMGIAEGVETALSAQAMKGISVWASLGSTRLHSVVLPDVVREVHVFADNDGPGAKAAARAVDVHTRAGRLVRVKCPPPHLKDYNDFLLALADRSVMA